MKEKKQYSWDAKEYAKHSSAQQVWARELIAKLQLRGNESLLDIGCGDGKITAEIAEQLPEGEVLGIDSSPDMIALARKHFPQSNHPNLSFELADASHLLFEKQFDLVFSNAALHWIKDHKPVLSGIQKSLKAEGRAFLQMGGKGNAEAIISLVDKIINEKEWRPFFTDFSFPYSFYEPEEYTQWLNEANLRPKRVELIPKDMSYGNKDGLAGWLRTTWFPYTDRVPVALREKFVSRIINKYLETNPLDNEGCIHVDMIRLEVEANTGDER
ncbi:MAG: SAM-dependent methyltransferase [Desulfocapsa sp.]|nr:MAG: SAM-dependent methyltransferase [Desulfocapsa sp.]